MTIDLTEKQINEIYKEITSLKNKIEDEIKKINNLFEKTNDELTKIFQSKHEILLKQEKDLKEGLQNEVTKFKEKLEYSWSSINNEIKICEKISKGIKKLEKEEKNIIKTLSFISIINKNQKEMEKLLSQIMKNVKFFYEEEKNIIKYEYCFNGIPIPKDIEIKNLSKSSFNLYWKVDIIIMKNINNEQIKFKVEIKKENNKFIKIYEGNKNNFFVNNLEPNTNYEIRICSFYNDSTSLWSQIKKIKTEYLDSIILSDSPKKNEFTQKTYEWNKGKGLELIYRGTRDGMTSNNFHNKCDNKGPTIILYRHEKGFIFGGYASISWSCSGGYKNANDCFLFTLSNIHNTQPTKFPSNNNGNNVYHGNDYGPYFGYSNDIGIYNNFIKDNCCSYFPKSYQDILGKGISIFTGDANNSNFKVNEIEVFKILS